VTNALCSFFAGRGPAYSGPQRWDHIAVQCACPGRGRELVGVCVVVKVVLKRRRGPPYPQSSSDSHPGHPSETSPLLVYFEHEKYASVASSVVWLLGTTTALVVIMMTLRHTSGERLAQELSTGSLHVVHSSRVNSSSTVAAKIYWHWLKCTTVGFNRTHTGRTY